MNYQKIYDSIILKALNRGLNKKKLSFYTEKHHIIPKCMNGLNEDSNYVLLTGREHYLCHWLLWKTNKENTKLLCAYKRMLSSKYDIKVTSKQYEILKINFSKYNSKALKGRIYSLETLEKMKASAKLRVKEFPIIHSEETKEKISKGNIGKKCSEETRKRISNALKGKAKSKEHIDKCIIHLQTNEAKEKRSKSLKGRIPWNKGLKRV